MIGTVLSAVRRKPETTRRPVRSEGFTLLEILVVIILVLVLFGVASWHLLPLPAAAEAAAVERNIAVMRSALGTSLAARVLGRDGGGLGELHRDNPVSLLEQPPGNYLGELAGPDPAAVEAGHWYFDTEARELVYRVRAEKWFVSELDGPPRIRLRLILDFSDRDGNGRFDSGTDVPHGLELRSPDDYEWREPSIRGLLQAEAG